MVVILACPHQDWTGLGQGLLALGCVSLALGVLFFWWPWASAAPLQAVARCCPWGSCAATTVVLRAFLSLSRSAGGLQQSAFCLRGLSIAWTHGPACVRRLSPMLWLESGLCSFLGSRHRPLCGWTTLASSVRPWVGVQARLWWASLRSPLLWPTGARSAAGFRPLATWSLAPSSCALATGAALQVVGHLGSEQRPLG